MTELFRAGALPLILWRHRELLVHLIRRNLKVLYKQSFLGYAWLIVNPLTQIFILRFIFSTIFRTSSEGIPFALFLFTGLLPWIFFSTALGSATESIVSGGNLIGVVYFPREVLVASSVLTRVFDLAAGAAILIVLLIYNSVTPDWNILWVPLIFAIQLAFTFGLALPLAALNLFFHDVRYLVGVILNLWFFLTPIFYSTDIVPSKYRLIYDLNPNTRFINGYRNALLFDRNPTIGTLAASVGMALVTLVIGYFIFKWLEPKFADYL
jgi:lipopolysaccharide transport system permease protein